jgi:FlaA1/EpsC-like NDP-sugar epimerase
MQLKSFLKKMRNQLKNKTILVTGGAGSIGSEIVKALIPKKPKKIIVFDIDDIALFIMQRTLRSKILDFIVGDIRDSSSVEKIFSSNKKPDLIYHAAAMKHVVMCERFPLETVKTNIFGTQNLVDSAIKHGVEKMITISTDKAADPSGVMGATKFIAERITLNGNSLSGGRSVFACVRFGNVANSAGSVIPVFIENLLKGKQLLVTDPEVTRFTMRIPDAVNLILKATEYSKGGEIFAFKMKAFKLGDLVDVIVNRIAPKLNIQNARYKITGLVGKAEKLHEKLIANSELNHVYDRGDMYIITPKKIQNSAVDKAYSSDKVSKLSPKEIYDLVVEYLKQNGINFSQD